MFLKFYTNTLHFSEKKFASVILSLISFWEAIIFPLPPDLILIPMSLAQQRKALYFASLATFFSVLGGMIGYLLGKFFWASIGMKIVTALGYKDAYSSFIPLFTEYGVLIILIGAITPFPFKIIAILAGVMGYPLFNFLIACLISRGFRFYLIGGIIFIWGKQIDNFLKNYLGFILVGFTLIAMTLYLFLR